MSSLWNNTNIEMNHEGRQSTVGISMAKQLIGKTCSVFWLDRTGRESNVVSRVHDVAFVPLYGGYLVTDTEDVRLDKITSVFILAEDGSTQPAFQTEAVSLPAAA
jgi:hypothetical protein